MVLELEPMIWAYVLDVKIWFTPDFYVQYGKNFKNVWAASAYKGWPSYFCLILSLNLIHDFMNM
jgi:hypothetical protein